MNIGVFARVLTLKCCVCTLLPRAPFTPQLSLNKPYSDGGYENSSRVFGNKVRVYQRNVQSAYQSMLPVSMLAVVKIKYFQVVKTRVCTSNLTSAPALCSLLVHIFGTFLGLDRPGRPHGH